LYAILSQCKTMKTVVIEEEQNDSKN